MDDGTQMKYNLQVFLAIYFWNMDNFENKYFLTKSKIIKWTQYIYHIAFYVQVHLVLVKTGK